MNFFKRNWHLLWLVSAVTVFAVFYMAKVVLTRLSSDSITILCFFRDVVQQGHPAKAWFWCGESILFPDLILLFSANYLIKDGLVAMEFCNALFFLAWIGLLAWAYQSAGGRRPAIFLTGTAFLTVGLIVYFLPGWFTDVFCIQFNGGVLLSLFAGWALTFRVWNRGGGIALGLLAAVTLLASASNALFIVCFTGPTCFSLAATACLHPRTLRARTLILAGTIGLSSVIGYLGVPYVFPPQLATALYTQFRPDAALNSLNSVIEAFDSSHLYWVILVLLDVATVAAGAGYLILRWKRLAPLSFLILVNGLLVIIMDWGAAILTGNFGGLPTIRYVAIALLLPLIVILVLLTELIPWNRLGGQILAVVAGAFAVFSMLHPLPPSIYWVMAQKMKPVLRQFKQEGITAGLSEYWYAKVITFLTDDEVPIRQIVPSGQIYRWVASMSWYTEKEKPNPEFRFILMKDLDPNAIRACYGAPARTMTVDGVGDLWIYAPEDAITYQDAFDEMGSRHSFPQVNCFSSAGAGLPSQTGHVEGTARVAQPGKDSEGCLTFGPYLHPRPGRYRVEFHYAYDTPPAADKPVTYDVALNNQTQLAQGSLPCHQPGPDVLTCTVLLPPDSGNHPAFEARTFYHGSGDFRLNSLTITYLGAP